MPDSTIKIEGAKFLVTIDPQRRIIQDSSVLIEGQRITRIGKSDELADVPADRVIDASEMVVTPGFVNGHMHISYAHATRGVFPDDLGPAYLSNVFALQGAMTDEEEYLTSLLAITELLKYGTTCFVDPGSTKGLDACLRAYEESGCRIVVGWQVTDRPNPINLPVYETAEAVRLMEQTVRQYDHSLEDRVRAWTMPFSPAFSSEELLLAAGGLAEQYGTRMTLHFNNGSRYVQDCQTSHGMRPTQYLESLGILKSSLTLAHGLGIDQSEVEAIARNGASVVMCPTAAIKGGERGGPRWNASGAAGCRRYRRTGYGRRKQFQPAGDHALHVSGGGTVQGCPPGRGNDPRRDGAGAGYHRGRQCPGTG